MHLTLNDARPKIWEFFLEIRPWHSVSEVNVKIGATVSTSFWRFRREIDTHLPVSRLKSLKWIIQCQTRGLQTSFLGTQTDWCLQGQAQAYQSERLMTPLCANACVLYLNKNYHSMLRCLTKVVFYSWCVWIVLVEVSYSTNVPIIILISWV